MTKRGKPREGSGFTRMRGVRDECSELDGSTQDSNNEDKIDRKSETSDDESSDDAILV